MASEPTARRLVPRGFPIGDQALLFILIVIFTSFSSHPTRARGTCCRQNSCAMGRAPNRRRSQLQREAGITTNGIKRSREQGEETTGLFCRAVEPCRWLAATKIKKQTFFPFLYAHARSLPTVSCFKALAGANTNITPIYARKQEEK